VTNRRKLHIFENKLTLVTLIWDGRKTYIHGFKFTNRRMQHF